MKLLSVIDVKSKAALYLRLVTRQQDEHGFIHSDECDSLLFTCLAACAGMEVDIWKAYDGQQWHRRPLDQAPCCPDHSKSSISRDMLLGVMWLAFARNDLALIDSVLRQMNKVVMGKWVGAIGLSRVIPTPGLYATARILRRRILHKGPGIWRFVPAADNRHASGYQGHLKALHIALRSVCVGKLTKLNKKTLECLYKRNYMNPLFAALAAGPAECIGILRQTTFWPDTHLPTTRERGPAWLPERDLHEYTGNPYTPVKFHSGMDFNFTLWITILWASSKFTQ